MHIITMSRVHPSSDNKCQEDVLLKEIRPGVQVHNKEEVEDHDHDHGAAPAAESHVSVLTVWKRSSMSFQGTDGFTVFDDHGRLAYRVDNYSRKRGGGLVLMDGAGRALLTLRPQVLSMQYQWNAYRGETEDGFGTSSRRKSTSSIMMSGKVFSMRRRRRSSGSVFFHSGNNDEEAEVFLHGGSPLITKEKGDETSSSSPSSSSIPDFRIGGCFRRRNCIITCGRTGQLVAKIARKKVNSTILLGDDVFSLTVQPGFHIDLIMAFVIILDRICGKPYAPVLCS
nr:protein LURP-one-related 5-like isoform X2 [Ziziphus jujuba var. spinosa]